MEIIKYPDDILRMKSESVKIPLSKEDAALLDSMYAYVKNPENGAAGLSAIQVGVNKRMCAIILPNERKFFKLVNPKIIWHSANKFNDTEGCLSVPGEYDQEIPRWWKIRVIGYDAITSRNITIQAEGFFARVLQHEIDHMDGKLFIDYIKEEE